jgi:FMN-dependent oxidoreductase (nitrilotriacetate monooxygenase family)
VIKDRRSGVYADPARVHDINHRGRYYQVPGCHLGEPSPQRTPVLYQAGASPRRQAFAARHAVCVFVLGPTPGIVGGYAQGVRAKAAAAGRDPAELKVMALVKVITADTEAAARRKLEEYAAYISYDGALALLSGWTGLDFSAYAPDQKLRYVETNAIRSLLEGFTSADPNREWTMRDLATYVGIGGAGPVLVGAYEQIADELARWVAAGIDGFNLAYGITPGSFVDFIDGVVPILQARGLVQTEYAPGTYREKLQGSGQRLLPDSHPAAGHRRLGQDHDRPADRAPTRSGRELAAARPAPVP